MKNLYTRLFIYTFLVCSSCSSRLTNLNQSSCEKYEYGRIETRHTLLPEEKIKLEKQGIRILEFVFENQYLGVWKKSWNKKNLEKTVIKILKPFTMEEKMASGGQTSELTKIVQEPGESIVLIQTIGPVNVAVLSEFGKIQFERDLFYRMVVPHHKLMELLEFSCVRTFSIMKENYQPD